MDQGTNRIFFALLRSAIRGTRLQEDERNWISAERITSLMALASKHDLSHLLAYGLKQNGLIPTECEGIENNVFKAVYRCEQFLYEYRLLCDKLEEARIPFVPLKGSVLRSCYPEEWMRTSCDIDILVHREDLDRAISYLTTHLMYTETERATHDVSLFSQSGIHVELHFDLVEEGRANNAAKVLGSVWENVSLRTGKAYWYEMSDAFFYFYHIAHMAKHFESGGCGIRPFIDLLILDSEDEKITMCRDELLTSGGLLTFANSCRILSEVWFADRDADPISLKMQDYILHGGVYGSSDNRVMLNQKKKGGRVGYLISRIFIPYSKLKLYYPILEHHRWLMLFMQVRRWFMLLDPKVAKAAKAEMRSNARIDKNSAEEMRVLLNDIGL